MSGDALAATPTRHAAVKALLRHVEPQYRSRCRAVLHGEPFSFSQAWQDWYTFHNVFSDRLTWGDGTFVDIGANQPTVISNTLFFEKCLGWRGVCFEPQRRYHAEIARARNCTLVPHCVVGKGESKVGEMRGMHLHQGAGAERCVDAGEALLAAPGGGRVDLLSIDIEGMEPQVLRCFPFDTLSVHAILIETNQLDAREADLFFHRHGYVNEQTFIGTNDKKGTFGWLDNLYVKRPRAARYPPTSYRCDDAARVHRSAWCGPWVTWGYEPLSRNGMRNGAAHDSKVRFGPCLA
ncbi:hypothetical protein AB1Y20_014435 [Prymnesium parvum]|uniref:Methyltransferase FkbM domain-containing protein n=1 Tax=Prymnesium parvum TaxID=97485 RepID=A0AB34IGS0_PRYPA